MSTVKSEANPGKSETNPETNASNSDSADQQVEISVNDLIVGRTVKSPIMDMNGLLLLSEGQIITTEIKQNLKQRNLSKIKIDASEAKRVTATAIQSSKVQPSIIKLDSELTNKLDSIIDSGLLNVSNKGPAVKDSVVFLGRQGYDTGQRDKLVNQHQRNGKALGNMMTEALHGEDMDGSIVATMAADYLKEMTTDTDNTLTSVIGEYSSDNLAARSMESGLLSMAIAIELGLDADNVRHLGIAGLVHDWGMMKVPEEIRNAPRRLNPIEELEIKKHPIHSLEILQRVSALPRVVSVVAYQVHERINGKGYPRGRRGNSIHLFARILQVADAYTGMTSQRPHRPPMTRYAAMECLIRLSKEKAYDPDVVRALLNVQSLFPIGSYVTLSDGRIAQVIRRCPGNYSRPVIQIMQDSEGNEVDLEDDSNLIDLSETELQVETAIPTPGSDEVPLDDNYLRYGIEG